MKEIRKKIVGNLGYHIIKKDTVLEKDGVPVDIIEPDFIRLYKECLPYTFTTVEPMHSLYKSVKYIIHTNIPADFVEYRGKLPILILNNIMCSSYRTGLTTAPNPE